MRLLLIESSADFCRVLENVLARGEFRVQSCATPEQGWAAYCGTPSDMVLMELPVDVAPAETFLAQLRAHPTGAAAPVVLMSEVHHKDSKVVDRITRSFQLQEFLPRPFEMFGLAKRLRDLSHTPSPLVAPASPLPPVRPRAAVRGAAKPANIQRSNSVNFRILLQIWQEKKTGILRCKGDENWISVYSGGLSSNADTTKVSALLQRSNLEFQEIEQDGQGDSSRMASLLWREAEAHVPVSFEIQLDKRCIETINGKRLLDELPLSEQTRRVLDQSKPHCSTTELLSELDVPATAVVRQLGALRALGLIRLGPIATRPQLGRRNKRTASEAGRRNTRQASARVRSHPAATPDPALVLRRLKSEFERLKHADPHTILGLPRDCGADLLHGATQRMESRYSLQSRDPDLPKEARKIAAQLARMVVEAETSILSADAKPRSARTAAPPSPAPQNAAPSLEELAFSEGTKAFAAGDFKRATQCFRKARDEKIDSVRNLAWLGWAVFHHPNMPEDERIEESTDLLRLAVSFDPRNRQAQFFLAYIESKVGQAESAIKRLESVVRMHPDHREAKRLLHMLVSKAS